MKILILHQHFKTPARGGAIRSYYLAKALVDAGHQVIIISGGEAGSDPVEFVEGIEVHNLNVRYNNNFGFGARSLSFIKYVLGAIKLSAKFSDSRYCYAISTPLTVGVAAQIIKRRYAIPFFFEVGDLWPEAPVQMGFVRNFILKGILYQLEKSIYQSADKIIALSEPIKSAIEKTCPGKAVVVIPNMADTDFFQPQPKNDAFAESLGVKGKFVVGYFGAIGLANGLDYLIECANQCRKSSLPIHFLIIGDGAVKERLKNNAHKLGLANLSFLDFTNREGVKELYSVTDAAFISYKQLPVLETGSPNKYFDALASGKLIITNFGGWIKSEVEANRCGFTCNPNDPVDFVTKIQPIINDSALLLEYKTNSRALALKNYSRKELSKKFELIFK